jgi:hypothetical protein
VYFDIVSAASLLRTEASSGKSFMMDILQATREYEQWMARHIPVIKADIRFKHAAMAQSPFTFLRGTYYRWVQLIARMKSLQAPKLLGVGDLHVENFGTWRDAEGRLIWGVNDFDEASPQPYILDVVRLVASAHLATRSEHFDIRPKRASALIWEGYVGTLKAGGSPFVLEEYNPVLRRMALSELRDPEAFWEKLQLLPPFRGIVPNPAERVLKDALPAAGLSFLVKKRRAGVGSLGRPRLVALAQWRGGLVAREAKALLPSAVAWAHGIAHDSTWIEQIAAGAVRIPDPFMHIQEGWIVRRLSPHCSRIELTSLPLRRDEETLLHAMGAETANIHLGSFRAIDRVIRDADKRTGQSLHQTVKLLVEAVLQDWKVWRSHSKP